MRDTGATGKRARGALVLFALFSCGAAMFLLAAGSPKTLSSVPVLEEDAGELAPRLLAARKEKTVLVCGDRHRGVMLSLEGESGRVLARAETDAPIAWAGLRGDMLWVREDGTHGAQLACLDPETLEERERLELEPDPAELLLFDTDGAGRCAWVEAGSMAVLRREGEEPLPLDGEIVWLGWQRDGGLLAATQNTLYLFGAQQAEIACSSPVAAGTQDGLLLERDGVFFRCLGTETEPLLRWETGASDSLSFCLDGEKCLILSETGGRVRRVSLTGQVTGECRLESTALAVCPWGALTAGDGALCYTPFVFSAPFGEESQTSPSPEPGGQTEVSFPEEERQEPTPQAAPPVSLDGEYLLVEAGTTMEQLRALLWPDAAVLRDSTGQPASAARLATGMTVNDWTVVVIGDCNGTGTVNRSDLLQAIVLCFSDGMGPYCRAADMNDDGWVGTADLLLLRKLVRGE